MTVNVVEIESNYEEVTRILYTFRVERIVRPYFRQKEFNVTELFGNDAIRSNFATACRLSTVNFITGGGHGNVDVFTGYNYDEIWKVGNYDPLEPKGKIIHLMSCLTAKTLGHDLIDNGCLAFFGYDVEFSFPQYSDGVDPVNDPRITPFFEFDSSIDTLLSDGLPAREIYKKVMQLAETKIEELAAMPDSGPAAQLLYTDSQHLRLYGNSDISLPVTPIHPIEAEEISLDNPVSYRLPGTGSNKEYVIKGVESGKKLTIDLNGPAGVDFDLYVKLGSKATVNYWDYRGYNDTANEEITVDPTVEGDYYITVNAYNGGGLYSLKASIPSTDGTENELTVGETISDTIEDGESKNYIVRNLEGGKDLVVLLDGPAGKDFDLYIKHKSVPTLEDWDARGYTGTSREKVRIYPTKYSGNYYVMVHSARGSGKYSLKAVV